jgi:hypothetical protein
MSRRYILPSITTVPLLYSDKEVTDLTGSPVDDVTIAIVMLMLVP